MERKSRKNRRMSDGKKNIISALIEKYDIQSADEIVHFPSVTIFVTIPFI